MLKIICENGVNFRNMEEAKLMIKKAKEIGAEFSKFQIYDSALIKDNPNREFLESIKLDYNRAEELFDYGQSIGQEVFFSCMTLESIDWCEEIGVNYYKIRYADRNDNKITEKIKNTKKPYFISRQGFDDLTIFKEQKGILTLYTKKDSNMAKILWCVPDYPASKISYPRPDIYGFYENYDGYSDHSTGLELFENIKKIWTAQVQKDFYFEKHVCLTKDVLEADWSVTFDELENALEEALR